MISHPPPAPTATPIASPIASSSSAATGPLWAASSVAATPAIATSTTGVAIPSLSPLSTLISRRIRAGTAGLTIMLAPSAASVGASAAPTSNASQISPYPGRASASKVPRPIVSGSPMPSSRTHRPASARRLRRPTREASENSTRASVASASSLTDSWLGSMLSGRSGPWVSTSPATVNRIGAVISVRSSRADKTPHTKISAATIARSATVTVLPSPPGAGPGGQAAAAPR